MRLHLLVGEFMSAGGAGFLVEVLLWVHHLLWSVLVLVGAGVFGPRAAPHRPAQLWHTNTFNITSRLCRRRTCASNRKPTSDFLVKALLFLDLFVLLPRFSGLFQCLLWAPNLHTSFFNLRYTIISDIYLYIPTHLSCQNIHSWLFLTPKHWIHGRAFLQLCGFQFSHNNFIYCSFRLLGMKVKASNLQNVWEWC